MSEQKPGECLVKISARITGKIPDEFEWKGRGITDFVDKDNHIEKLEELIEGLGNELQGEGLIITGVSMSWELWEAR